MRWRNDDEGLATLPSFLVATGVFTIVFATVTYFASDYISEERARDNNLDQIAAAALSALQSSPGVPSDWHDTGAPLVRWGLLKEGGRSTLDAEKAKAVRDWAQDLDKYLDAKEAVGLSDYDMRLRLYPKFEVDGVGLPALEGRKVAYVGAYTSGSGFATWVEEETDGLALSGVTYVDTLIDTNLADGIAAGDLVPDDPTYLERDLTPRLFGFAGAQDNAGLGVHTSHWQFVRPTYGCWGAMDAGLERVLTMSMCDSNQWVYGSSYATGAVNPVNDRIALVEVDLRDLDGPGDDIKLTLTHYVDHYDDPVLGWNSQTSDYGEIAYYCLEGCGVPAWQPALHQVTSAGTPAAFATQDFSLNALAGKRVLLALSWYAWRDLPDEQGGDGWFISKVSVDVKKDGASFWSWENDLKNPRSIYDSIVMGSDVDQADLSTSTFSNDLLDWIDEGGHLLVTGNGNPTLAWLGAYGQAGTPPAIGGSFFEDKSDHLHAIVNNPHNLRYTTYATPLLAYKVNPAYLSTPVKRIQHDNPSNPVVPLLSVPTGASPWGTPADDGVVVVTAYRPVDLGAAESANFYANVFVYQYYNAIELDYGGTVPKSHDIGSAARTVLIDASSLTLGTLEAQLVLHVWQ